MGNATAIYTVLVIEPEQDIIDILELALQQENMKVIGLSNYTSAISDQFKYHRIDIAIVSFHLINASWSIEALKIIKSVASIPVLAISCDIDIEEKSNFYGFNGYINKPFDIDELPHTLREFL